MRSALRDEHNFRRGIYRFMEPSATGATKPERAFDIFIISMIGASVVAMGLRTVQSLPESFTAFLGNFQIFATMIFTIEYVLRLYSCTTDTRYSHPVWGRLRFMVSPMAIVDLLAVGPFIVLAIVSPTTDLAGATLVLRLLRLLKLFRYSHALTVFGRVLNNKANQLVAALVAIGVLLVFSSTLVYFAEHSAQPEVFSSMPETMWWGIITLTTVGYGNMVPVTPVGQVFGGLTALLGIGIVALPSGILASGFIQEFSKDQHSNGRGDSYTESDQQRCPHCGNLLEQQPKEPTQ